MLLLKRIHNLSQVSFCRIFMPHTDNNWAATRVGQKWNAAFINNKISQQWLRRWWWGTCRDTDGVHRKKNISELVLKDKSTNKGVLLVLTMLLNIHLLPFQNHLILICVTFSFSVCTGLSLLPRLMQLQVWSQLSSAFWSQRLELDGGRSFGQHAWFIPQATWTHCASQPRSSLLPSPHSATPNGMTPTLCTFRHSQQGALIDKRNAVAGVRNGDSEWRTFLVQWEKYKTTRKSLDLKCNLILEVLIFPWDMSPIRIIYHAAVKMLCSLIYY